MRTLKSLKNPDERNQSFESWRKRAERIIFLCLIIYWAFFSFGIAKFIESLFQ